MSSCKCEKIQGSVVDKAVDSEGKEKLAVVFGSAEGCQASWENPREGSLISEGLIISCAMGKGAS